MTTLLLFLMSLLCFAYIVLIDWFFPEDHKLAIHGALEMVLAIAGLVSFVYAIFRVLVYWAS